MKKAIKLFLVLNITLSNIGPSYYQLVASEIRTTAIEVNADPVVEIWEEEEQYTDNQIYALFNVTHNAGTERTTDIDQSSVDYSVPGTYDVSFTVTDKNDESNTDTAVSQLIINDHLPTISAESNNVHHHVGIEPNYISDFGIVATEVTTGDLTDQVVVDDSQVDYMTEGDYPVYYTVTDEEGNVVTYETRVYFSNDAPTLSYLAEASSPEESVLSHSQLIDLFEVVAKDDDGVQQIAVDDTAVDYSTPGSYDIYFQAYDIYGAYSTERHAILNIEDIRPEVTCTQSAISIDEADSVDYIDLYNVVATEINEGDLTELITIDDSNVNLHLPGDYPVTFAVADEEGNSAECSSTLNIKYAAPEISSLSLVTVDEEQQKTDKQLINLFEVDFTVMGDYTISVDQSLVDYSKPGSYQVTFTISDNYESVVSTTATLVVEDVLPTLKVDSDEITYHIGSTPSYIDDFGLVATEFSVNDIIDSVEIDDSAVSMDEVGTYPVQFTAVDSDGNEVSKQVNVVVENDNPVITGKKQVTIDEQTTYNQSQLLDLFNIEATDTDQITSIKILDLSIDFDVPGTYDLEIEATDEYGAKSDIYQVELIINDVLPTITVPKRINFLHIGDSLDFESAYKYEATEFKTGDLTDSVEVDDSKVNYEQIGPYPVFFKATDNDGNSVVAESILVITDDSPSIEADLYAQSPEDLVLGEQDILHLFNIQIIDEDAIKSVTVDLSDVDFYTPDSYYVGFSAEDEYGKRSDVLYTELEIVDSLPVIETEEEEVTIHIGDQLDIDEAYGVVGTEHNEGDLTAEIVIDDTEVNYSQTGTYTITLKLTDNEGNKTSEIIELTIENDNPVITGQSASSDEETSNSDDQLLSLLDIEVTDEDQIESITVDQSIVDYSTPGTYPVTITATDEYGATTTSAYQLEVVDQLPVLNAENDTVEIEIGDSLDFISDYQITASEVKTNDLLDSITIDDSQVNYEQSGQYPIIIKVTDEEQNSVSLKLTLIINANNSNIIYPNIGSNDVIKSDEEDLNFNETNTDYRFENTHIEPNFSETIKKEHIKHMLKLQQTGQKVLRYGLYAILILILLIMIKKFTNRDK